MTQLLLSYPAQTASVDWGVSLDHKAIAEPESLDWQALLQPTCALTPDVVVDLVKRRHELNEWKYPKPTEEDTFAAAALREALHAFEVDVVQSAAERDAVAKVTGASAAGSTA